MDGRTALDLSDCSEERLRWLTDLPDRSDDAAAAVELYGRLAGRLALEYDLEPTATRAAAGSSPS